MNYHRIITAILLMLPGLSWGPPPTPAPEPSVLPLLAIGGVAVLAVNFMRRKK